jgi:hypothetical protein
MLLVVIIVGSDEHHFDGKGDFNMKYIATDDYAKFLSRGIALNGGHPKSSWFST